MVQVERTDIARQQKYDEISSENDPTRRRDISEITLKHLEQVINTMIPSSTCSTSDPTENIPTNCLATQWGDEEEKQVIVNNYYIRDKTEGWKHIKQGDISPNTSRSHTQIKSSKISPNETMLEIMKNEGLKTLEELFTYIREDTEVMPRGGPDKRTIKEQQRFHAEGPEV